MKKILSVIASVTLVMALFCGSFAFADPALDESAQTTNGLQKNESSSFSTAADPLSKDNNNSQDQTNEQTIGDEPKSVNNQSSVNVSSEENTDTAGTESALDISSSTVEVKGLVRNLVSGAQLRPEVTLRLNGQVLNEGSDYTLYYNDSTEVPMQAGEYTLVAKGIEENNCSGEVLVGTFSLYSSPVKAGVIYQIASATNSNLVLDAAKNPPVSGANVAVYMQHGGANQNWTFELQDDGYYIIRNVANSNLILDAANSKPTSGSNVSAWEDNGGGLNQRWIVVPDDSGYVQIINAANNDLVLDAANSKPKEGSNVSAYEDNGGGLNQRWELKSGTDIANATVDFSNQYRNCTGKTLTPDLAVTVFNVPLEEGKDYSVLYNGSSSEPSEAGKYTVSIQALGGTYSGVKEVGTFYIYPALTIKSSAWIASATNSNLVLDAAKNPPVSGANVAVYMQHGGANQNWTFELQDDGYYIIRNVANSNLILDAANSKPTSGSNVSAWEDNGGGLNQRWIVVPDDSGYVQIINAANNDLVLDAANSKPKEGSNVSAYEDNGGGLNQRWELKSFDEAYAELDGLAKDNASLVQDGTYTLYSMLDSHPVVDVASSATIDGANVQVEQSRAKDSQVWEVSHDENGYVLLKNKNSGKYLGVQDSRVANEANVVQKDYTDDRSIKWIVIENSSGSYSIQSAIFTNFSLDVYKGAANSGTNVEIYQSNGAAAQSFGLIETPAIVEPCEPILNEDTYYFVRPAGSESLQLDVEGSSTNNGANVDLWSDLNMMHQMFSFKYENGYYRIINAKSGKVLDVDGSSLVPHSNVIQYNSSETGDNQLWSVSKSENGAYSFINKKNGLLLNIDESEVEGSNIDTDLAGNSDLQSFDLVEVKNLMPTGLYKFTSALNSSMALDVADASKDDNAKIEIWSSNTGFAQKWWVQLVSGKDNTYTLQAVCSGKYLADSNGRLIQTVTTQENAQWTVLIKNGKYAFINAETGRALDVSGSGTSSGTAVQTWDYHGGNNQLWTQTSTPPISSGTYIIRSLVNSNQVVDIANSSTSNGASADMWQYHGGGNQKYSIYQNSDGTYTIVNCASGKALDANKGSSDIGTSIIQYTRTNTVNQKWNIIYGGDGGYKLVSAMDPSIVIAFSGTSPVNGSKLALAKDTGDKSQHFTFETTTYVPPMPTDQRAMLNRINGYSSGTQWLIAVDRSTHRVGVFKGSTNNWSLQYYWSCVTGAPGSPTITGSYTTTGFKRTHLTTDSRAIWCTQIWGGYFFHSILASESELGQSLSHGCIRLPYSAASWIYNNINAGTRVVIYN